LHRYQHTTPFAGGFDAQQNVPPPAQDLQRDVERVVRRYQLGVHGGVGIDPEVINVGGHGLIGPIFSPNVAFRPGLEIGIGEVTTLLAINLDVLYSFNRDADDNEWAPYAGAGPAFGLSHRGFEADGDNVSGETPEGDIEQDARNRFDFSDTDFDGGINFIVGMRKGRGFFEMRSTAWGVSNIRLVAGFNF